MEWNSCRYLLKSLDCMKHTAWAQFQYELELIQHHYTYGKSFACFTVSLEIKFHRIKYNVSEFCWIAQRHVIERKYIQFLYVHNNKKQYKMINKNVFHLLSQG